MRAAPYVAAVLAATAALATSPVANASYDPHSQGSPHLLAVPVMGDWLIALDRASWAWRRIPDCGWPQLRVETNDPGYGANTLPRRCAIAINQDMAFWRYVGMPAR